MSSFKLNISIPPVMADFLKDNPSLSPSKIFQGAVENIQNSIKHNPQLMEALKTIELLRKQKEKIQENLQAATNFIEEKGFWEQFVSEVKIKL